MKKHTNFFALALILGTLTLTSCASSPYVGENGNWWYDTTDLGVPATGPQGPQGDKGDQGESGVSIIKIEKTNTEGNVDTYTITYSDGTTSTFVVVNGINGEQGIQGVPGEDGHSPIVRIGDNGNWFVDNVDTNIKAQGPKGDKGDKGDTGKSAYEIYIEAHPKYVGDEQQWLDDLLNGRLGNKEKHTVKFNTGTEQTIPDQVIEHGEKIGKPVNPFKEGYTFGGWYYQDEPWSFIGYVVTEDIVLDAKWDLKQFTFTYNLDSGQDPVTKKYGWNTLIDLPTPQKEGLKFLKWVDESGQEITLPLYLKKDLSITAKYTYPIDVTFDSNGGSALNNITLYQEEVCTELPIPTKDAAVFLGWYYDNGISEVEIKAPFIVDFGVKNITLKAMWRITAGDYQYIELNDGTVSITGYTGQDKDIVIPNELSNKIVSKIDNNAFKGNENLNSVVLGNNIKRIGVGAFENCTNLTSINFKNTELYGDNILLGCKALINITIRNNISILALFGYKEENIAKCINLNIIYNEKDKGTTISKLLKNITSLKINCTYLEGFVNIPYDDFNSYTNLMSVKLPSTLKSIGDKAFYECDNLVSIKLPEGLTTLGAYCFYYCNNLTDINFPLSLSLLGGGCLAHTNIKEAVIPNDDCVLGGGVFFCCENLKTLRLPNNITTIEDEAFANCVNLTKLDLPRSVETVYRDSFGDCLSITELRFYGSKICNIAFIRNTSLTTVYLGKNLKIIEENAFLSCDNIETIYYEGTQREWNDLIIDIGNESLTSKKIIFNSVF